MTKVLDVKKFGRDDKLIIQAPAHISEVTRGMLLRAVSRFIKSKKQEALVVSEDFTVFIIKDGQKIKLAKYFEEEMKKEKDAE